MFRTFSLHDITSKINDIK